MEYEATEWAQVKNHVLQKRREEKRRKEKKRKGDASSRQIWQRWAFQDKYPARTLTQP